MPKVVTIESLADTMYAPVSEFQTKHMDRLSTN
jgi:hypothetical protein